MYKKCVCYNVPALFAYITLFPGNKALKRGRKKERKRKQRRNRQNKWKTESIFFFFKRRHPYVTHFYENRSISPLFYEKCLLSHISQQSIGYIKSCTNYLEFSLSNSLTNWPIEVKVCLNILLTYTNPYFCFWIPDQPRDLVVRVSDY